MEIEGSATGVGRPSLDLRGLEARIVSDDGDLVLVVHDGDEGMTLESGAGGSFEDAIRGAERLADAAMQFAALLQVRAGSWRPLTRLSQPMPIDVSEIVA